MTTPARFLAPFLFLVSCAAGAAAPRSTASVASAERADPAEAQAASVAGALAAPQPAQPTHASPAAGAALEAALSSVSADEIRSDLFFIASDELEGRDTPSAGLKIAARFLRARLQRLGWQPGAKDGYFFPWQVEKKSLDPAGSRVEFAGKTLLVGRDYYLSGFGVVAEREASGALVFAGEGKREDVEKLEVEGKWVLVVDRDQELGAVRRDLGKRKALGLVLFPAEDYAGKTYAERFEAEFGRQKEGRVQQAADPSDSKEPRDDRPRSVASIYLLPAGAAALLPALGVDPKSLQVGQSLGLELKETRALLGKGGLVEVENVCGFWPGSDPVLKNEVLLVTAHYDHVGVMRGKIYNGADDNGSGTCCLLALAEALKQYGPLRRSVMLMWVCGEEKGLWGSEAWNKHPYLPEGCKAVADINIDMVGRNAPEKLLITPTEKHKSYSFLTRVAEHFAPLEGFHGPADNDPPLGSADEYWTRSDHYNFVKAGIPACFLFSDVHEDYHQPTDDPEKIDYDKIHRVARLVLRILDGLQNDKIDGG